MKLFPGVPPYQRWMMALTFVFVAGYALSQNKERVNEIAKMRLSSPIPSIIDGDTVDFPNGARVRVVGMDAPDDDRPQLKIVSTQALSELAKRDGGLDCSTELFDFGMRREDQCQSPVTSYGRLNFSCRFKSNGASVAATMVAQGYAVDYRQYSGGAYVDLMQKAAASRVGLWGVDYDQMRSLAVARAKMPPSCPVNTRQP